jgi:hypothetical protein
MKRLIDLMLYGNIWIAWAAVASCWQGMYLIGGAITDPYLLTAVFFAAWLVYSWHRLRTAQAPSTERRIEIARALRPVLHLFLILGTLGLFFALTKLSASVIFALALPGMLALGYVWPVFFGWRLRDLPYLKIFLVSGAWAWVSAVLPAWHIPELWSMPSWLMLAERFCFFFALTLLFDWRDCQLDQILHLHSLPQRLGISGTQTLGAGALMLSAGSAVFNTLGEFYSIEVLLAILIPLFGAGILFLVLSRLRHDYYFSGAADGLILLQALLVWFF